MAIASFSNVQQALGACISGPKIADSSVGLRILGPMACTPSPVSLQNLDRGSQTRGILLHLSSNDIACSAVLAHIMLNERLNPFGMLGCVLCISGSVTIVLHAPEEREILSLLQVWQMALQPGKHSMPVVRLCGKTDALWGLVMCFLPVATII